MRNLMGLVVAAGLLLGSAGKSDAQFSLSIGNGYGGYGSSYYSSGYNGYAAGPGVIGYTSVGGYPSYGTNYGYNSGYAGYAPNYAYSSGYSGYAPNYAYNSGYSGYAPNYGYGVTRSYVTTSPGGYYGSYGNGGYGYGSRGGFRPLQGGFRRYR